MAVAAPQVEGSIVTRVKRDCQCPRARHVHGTTRAYQSDGCRCDECREACRIAENARRRAVAYGRWHHPEDPIGTTRRLQALFCLGWSGEDLASRIGMARSSFGRLLHGRTTKVQGRVADSVRAVYDELWDKRPPEPTGAPGWTPDAIRALARSRGWFPPLAWDDIDDPNEHPSPEVIFTVPPCKNIDKNGGRPANPDADAEILDEIAIEEAIAGRPVRLTRAEETVAQQRMRDMGYSQREIAERLRIAKRTVERRGRAA